MLKRIFTIIIFLALIISFAAFGLHYFGIKKINITLPIEETKNILSEIEKEINNPPPLKYDNLYGIRSNLTTPGVLQWTNEMRKENGSLNALSEIQKLDMIAKKRLADMFQKQYFEHVSPSGVSVSDVAMESGYGYITIGENIALGNFDGDRALVQAWMDSPGHRANILNERYTQIGIAVQKGLFEQKETWMAIQVFAFPLSACPAIDETLRQKIESENQNIISLQNAANELKNTLESSKPRTQKEIIAYNENVDKYNKIVSDINTLIKDTKQYISTYNAQIEAFNKCAKGA